MAKKAKENYATAGKLAESAGGFYAAVPAATLTPKTSQHQIGGEEGAWEVIEVPHGCHQSLMGGESQAKCLYARSITMTADTLQARRTRRTTPPL